MRTDSGPGSETGLSLFSLNISPLLGKDQEPVSPKTGEGRFENQNPSGRDTTEVPSPVLSDSLLSFTPALALRWQALRKAPRLSGRGLSSESRHDTSMAAAQKYSKQPISGLSCVAYTLSRPAPAAAPGVGVPERAVENHLRAAFLRLYVHID